jgi:ribose 1,5-bisphosphokinase
MDRPGVSPPGILVAVVGASGVGKDTIMRLAHESLRDEPRVHFVRRAITRPPEPSEDHEALDAD